MAGSVLVALTRRDRFVRDIDESLLGNVSSPVTGVHSKRQFTRYIGYLFPNTSTALAEININLY